MSRVKSWDPIVEKFSSRLSRWRASLLSFGGRATLITSVLGALGTYFFSLFPMPSLVDKKLESIRAKFFGAVRIVLIRFTGFDGRTFWHPKIKGVSELAVYTL